ncbi:UNVERIFIED_CONTAM: hypothetical protein RMT77_012487 [Armadillidium vulgare]
MKASCSFQGLEEESPQVSGEIQKSDAEISESFSISNDSDPDYSGGMSSSEQNRTRLRMLAEMCDRNARNICYKVIDNNSYFAHGENILIGMLADEDEEVRRKAVNKVLHLKGLIEDYHGEKDDFVGGTVESDDDNEANVSENDYPSMNKDVRVFLKQKINFKAVCYYKMTSISQWHTIPPVLRLIEEDKILEFIEKPLKLRHECHSQNVERHVKLVTEASASVVGHDRRDGVIRNKIRSRKLLKNFQSKSDFKF